MIPSLIIIQIPCKVQYADGHGVEISLIQAEQLIKGLVGSLSQAGIPCYASMMYAPENKEATPSVNDPQS